MATAKLQTLKHRLSAAPGRLKVVEPGSWGKGLTAAERGYDSRWQKARDGYLRLHPLCVMCRAEGRVTPATVVDHIKAHRGDKVLFWDKLNWQAICAPHHNSHAQKRDHADVLANGY